MTAEANTKWDYQDLTEALKHIEYLVTCYEERNDADDMSRITAMELRHAVKFIEHNMREMGINGDNGDE